jgi:ubiquinone/menaquinone biosynthesis C-methylase UbiE
MTILNKAEFLLMNNPIRAQVHERFELATLKRMLSADRFETILEVGCGNGFGTTLINGTFRPSRLMAVDLDIRMIRQAVRYGRCRTAHFQVMDASALAFADGAFDAVFDFGAIHHVPAWQESLEELRRVLKTGGRLALEEFPIEAFSGFPAGILQRVLEHPYADMFSIDEFAEQLGLSGFRIDDMRIFRPLRLTTYLFITATAV